ncbi:capsule assembly Wzi family protein [Larkinella soli]|uniref:capsule assembly Wzi family protein n=1 Tax=Larkinella soli TaxID=1770527 RepID=UPI000FFC8EBB|nr:capsule assembly Wzi family protein [Larkinella soli]
MKNRLFLLIPALLTSGAFAQKPASSVRFHAEVGALASSARQTPFWLRANQYGTVPSIGPLGTLRLGSSGRFQADSTRRRWYAGYGVELVGNAGPQRRLLLPEAYAKAGYGPIELMIGRRKEVMSLVDSSLSSGSYAWSGNALPIPKIQIGTSGFTPLKFTGGLIAVHAFLAHGRFADTDSIKNSYLHQKAIYGRLGKPHWKVKLYGGVLHNAQWGGRSDYLDQVVSRNGQLPSSFRDYVSVMLAKQPDRPEGYSKFDSVNRVGNHVGSIDVGMEVQLTRWSLLGYYQHPFEDKSGFAFKNLPDGLYGISLKRRGSLPSASFRIRRLLFEYLTTMSQTGSTVRIGSRLYEGIDDYFNNFQYIDGWTYYRRALGTPFLTPRQEIDPSLRNVPGGPKLTFVNNRVQLLHVGLAGSIASGIEWQTRLSYSRNLGLFRNPFKRKVGEFSGIVELKRPIGWLGGAEVRTAFAVDQGGLLPNSVGGWISLRKTW